MIARIPAFFVGAIFGGTVGILAMACLIAGKD